MATTGSGTPFTLTTTPVAVLSAGANELVIITRLQAYNSDTTSRVVTLHQVPSGGSVGATTKVHVQTVYAGQSTSIDFAGAITNNGGSIYASADVTSVVVLSANAFLSDQLP